MAEPIASKPPTEDELSFGLAGLAAPPLVAEKKPTPAVRWLTDKKRVETFDLAYPFELEGVEYRTVIIKRLTAAEVAAFMERMRAAPSDGYRFPMYFIGEEQISDAAWGTLDDDDVFALMEIGAGFLPARFRQGADTSSGLPTGDTTASS